MELRQYYVQLSIFITTRLVNASWQGCRFLHPPSLKCGCGSPAGVGVQSEPVKAQTASMKGACEKGDEEGAGCSYTHGDIPSLQPMSSFFTYPLSFVAGLLRRSGNLIK